VRLAASAVVLAVLAAAGDARAQGAGSAEAAELFKQGRAALEVKDYVAACPKLAASLQLERAVGTLISLAECEEGSGALAGARQHWQEAADLADASNDRLNRAPFARQRFADVDRRVPRLVVRLASGAPPDATFRRDDVQLSSSAFGAALPVDPGAHVITASAAGREQRTYRIELAEGDRKELEVAPGDRTAPPPAATPLVTAPTSTSWPPPAPPPARSSFLPTLGLATAALGVVGLGVGTGFGVDAISKKDAAASSGCNGNVCTPTAGATRNDAQSAGTLSTAFFVAGGVLAAAGVTLWLIAPRASQGVEVTPTVGPGSAGVTLGGTWR